MIFDKMERLTQYKGLDIALAASIVAFSSLTGTI